jgi:glycosyltransferase involved in cell wall biosynthesis
MPVYNGEDFIEEAIDSILAQTFTDFELIICDNASNDDTQRICRGLSESDKRISYKRNEKNMGAAWNYNRTFDYSTGEYFKWAAHDDKLDPCFLEKCVEVLDRDSEVVLCHPRTHVIDANGGIIGHHQDKEQAHSENKRTRFRALISLDYDCWAIFGIFRRSILSRTPRHGNYIGADRNLLAEISLIGRIHEVPEPLFLRRDHPKASTRAYHTARELMNWYDPENRNLLAMPYWKRCREYFSSVNRVQMKESERLQLYGEIFDWIFTEGWGLMGSDVESVIRQSKSGARFADGVKWVLRRSLIPLVKRRG